MKIVQLDIEGFRSLKNVSWKPGDLNVIIGPNGSGKSNLLRLLEMISLATQGQLNKYMQAAGGMEALVWDGEAASISFRLSLGTLNASTSLQSVLYEVRLNRYAGSYRIGTETLIGSGGEPFRLDRDGNEVKLTYQNLLWGFAENAAQETEVSFSAVSLIGLTGPANSGMKVNNPLTPLQKEFTGWSVLDDLNVHQNAPLRQPALTKYETSVTPDGQNLVNVLHTLYEGNREFERQVNSAMRVAFGNAYERLIFPPASDQKIQLRIRWNTLKREQSAINLSDGTLRFLFLLAVLASPNPPPLIAIDEPETGLHPSMLPLVAELAVDAAERTQVIFTTHSDQFLDAFRETGTRPTTTVAKWENGETSLTTLNDAELEHWLKEYSLGSLFRSGELENMAS